MRERVWHWILFLRSFKIIKTDLQQRLKQKIGTTILQTNAYIDLIQYQQRISAGWCNEFWYSYVSGIYLDLNIW